MLEAGIMKIMMMAIIGVAESIPTLTPMDHAFPDARTTTTHARHGHLLHGMLGDLESYVFDDVVEFLFQQLGEELPQARSRHSYRHPHHYYEDGDNYPMPSQYSGTRPKDQSCISMAGYTDNSLCLNIFTALSVAGVALLLQFLFFACVSNLCPSSIILSNSTISDGGSEPNNINNVITIDTSNDVSVQQNDNVNIIIDDDDDDDERNDLLLRADVERSDLDVDMNLGEDGGRNDLKTTEVTNENITENSTFNATTNGVKSEDVNGERVYMYYKNNLLRKRKQKQNEDEREGKTINQNDKQKAKNKEGETMFTMNISQDSAMGRFFSWSNWDLIHNTSICSTLGRYIQG